MGIIKNNLTHDSEENLKEIKRLGVIKSLSVNSSEKNPQEYMGSSSNYLVLLLLL